MSFVRFFLSAAFLLYSVTASAQKNDAMRFYEESLRWAKSLQAIIDSSGAQVGIGITGLDFEDSLIYNGKRKFPMQSVYKFPLAMAVLHDIDMNRLSLFQSVHISKKNLDTATWSPMVKERPNQDIELSIAELLRYSVSKSDNNACDVLFQLAGGPARVDSFIHSIGVRDIAIATTEAEMKRGWDVQYSNWCKPGAMLHLLRLLYEEKVLSANSNAFLMKLMTESENSPNRLKAGLPKGTVLAHKTGTSNANAEALIAAINDIGIVTLPNGKQYAIAVFVSDYKGGYPKGERIIADISRLAWEYLSKLYGN